LKLQNLNMVSVRDYTSYVSSTACDDKFLRLVKSYELQLSMCVQSLCNA